MTTKKSKAKSKRKATQKKPSVERAKDNYFVVVPEYESQADWEVKPRGSVLGPMAETKVLETIEDKVRDGCDRKNIVVLSGKKVSVQVKLR